MKRCFKCGEVKPLHLFYPHKKMADGHLNKCKECTLSDVKQRYDFKPEACAAYERKRSCDPERIALKRKYQQNMRARHPERYAARTAVRNAIRSGRLSRLPCEVCGEARTQGHHDDYSRPLDVRWLCFKHHREIGHGQRVLAGAIPGDGVS